VQVLSHIGQATQPSRRTCSLLMQANEHGLVGFHLLRGHGYQKFYATTEKNIPDFAVGKAGYETFDSHR
jgi:hypothetical protein